jgi:hypothetical protein
VDDTPANNPKNSPAVYAVVSTACSQPNAAEPKCPNVTSPGALYIERRLEVAF